MDDILDVEFAAADKVLVRTPEHLAVVPSARTGFQRMQARCDAQSPSRIAVDAKKTRAAVAGPEGLQVWDLDSSTLISTLEPSSLENAWDTAVECLPAGHVHDMSWDTGGALSVVTATEGWAALARFIRWSPRQRGVNRAGLLQQGESAQWTMAPRGDVSAVLERRTFKVLDKDLAAMASDTVHVDPYVEKTTQTLRVLDTMSGATLATRRLWPEPPEAAPVFTADSTVLALHEWAYTMGRERPSSAGAWPGPARKDCLILWDWRGDRTPVRLRAPRGTRCLQFSPDGHLLACASEGRTLTLWDLRQQSPQARSVDGAWSGKPRSIHFTPGGDLLAVVVEGQGVRFYDATSLRFLGELALLYRATRWIFLSPEGLFDGSDDLWEKVEVRLEGRRIPLDAFDRRYYRPGLLSEILSGKRPRAGAELRSLPLPPDEGSSSQRNVSGR